MAGVVNRKHRWACTVIALAFVYVVTAQAPNEDDRIWSSFVTWLKSQPPNGKPGGLIAGYRKHLVNDAVPAAEVSHSMQVISDYIFTRRHGVEVLWDKVFAASDNPIFTLKPTALLRDAIRGRKPGTALDIGMGQGRNAVLLAAEGWDVTGFDPSTEGVRIAKSNADKAGVKIHAIVARDDEFDYGSERWDLIVMTYVRDLTRGDAQQFWKALRPGGIVVYENGADGRNEVLKAFLDFQIVRFEDVVTTADWNPDRKTRVQRLVAQKRGR
jgi:SAM-dependent methyltransferase